MKQDYIHQPMKIGKKEIPARIVLPPMATGKTPDGKITEELCDYYEQRAKNPNVGLIITEHSFVTQQGKAHDNQVSAASDDMIPGMKMLADRVHGLENGTCIIMQISHAGGVTSEKYTGMELVGPSEKTDGKEPVRELTVEEIQNLEEAFADAAERAQKAGLDGIEIHAAHGYLLSQFFSPIVNHRTDQYGADTIENRIRFTRETLEAIRRRTGEDFLISVRMGGVDGIEGGTEPEDCAKAAAILEKAGADLIHISGGIKGYRIKGYDGPGYFRKITALVKQQIKIPVILTGGVTTLEEAETLLEQEKADLIGIGRALLKNPDLGKKKE